VPDLDSGGRRFESCLPDQNEAINASTEEPAPPAEEQAQAGGAADSVRVRQRVNVVQALLKHVESLPAALESAVPALVDDPVAHMALTGVARAPRWTSRTSGLHAALG
jgi:hypothetical protein